MAWRIDTTFAQFARAPLPAHELERLDGQAKPVSAKDEVHFLNRDFAVFPYGKGRGACAKWRAIARYLEAEVGIEPA